LLYLPPSLGAAFAVVGAAGRVAPGLVERAGPPLFFAIVLACAAAGGAAWARALARRARPHASGALGAALGYGLTVPLALWGLTAAETALLLRAQNGGAVPMHVVFGLLFPAAAFVVVFGTVLGLALGRRRGSASACGLALRCAAAGAGAFAGADVVMDVAGWRVGGPNAEARATMLVVLGLGLVAATLAAGAVLGRSLSAGPVRRDVGS
jgi:hypothetical protein